jgi:hypothetical protein
MVARAPGLEDGKFLVAKLLDTKSQETKHKNLSSFRLLFNSSKSTDSRRSICEGLECLVKIAMSNELLETLPIVLRFEKFNYGCDSSKQKYCIEFDILPEGEDYIFSTYIYNFMHTVK